MAKRLNTDGMKFLPANEAVAKTDFKTGEVSKDKLTDLPLWVVEGFLYDNGAAGEVVKLNIASAEQPKIAVTTLSDFNGDLFYTPYIANGTSKIASSYKLVGQLVASRPGKAE